MVGEDMVEHPAKQLSLAGHPRFRQLPAGLDRSLIIGRGEPRVWVLRKARGGTSGIFFLPGDTSARAAPLIPQQGEQPSIVFRQRVQTGRTTVAILSTGMCGNVDRRGEYCG